jgi:hypothetical protein
MQHVQLIVRWDSGERVVIKVPILAPVFRAQYPQKVIIGQMMVTSRTIVQLKSVLLDVLLVNGIRDAMAKPMKVNVFHALLHQVATIGLVMEIIQILVQ